MVVVVVVVVAAAAADSSCTSSNSSRRRRSSGKERKAATHCLFEVAKLVGDFLPGPTQLFGVKGFRVFFLVHDVGFKAFGCRSFGLASFELWVSD